MNSSLECLPGIDTVGIGFDAIKGQSFGVGRQVIDFTNLNGNQYLDPFGNATHYAYPDQVQVKAKSTQFMGHSVYRSVNEYVASQSMSANVDASFGGFFSASVATQSAKSTMQDGLHIVAESNCELGLYSITLDPSSLLTPCSKFQDYVSMLPETYDEDKYFQLISDYGTHYVAATTQGGLATMSTTISQDYYSQKSDSNIQAQLQVAWGQFGGGGGGGSSSKEFDASWTSNAISSTYTAGGDPSIKSFNSEDEWNAWAKSVTQGSPVVTSYTLEFLYTLIAEGSVRDNVKNATFAYAAMNNATFPVADPTSYQMDWCDCYSETTYHNFMDTCTHNNLKECAMLG